MANAIRKFAARKNGNTRGEKVSELGRVLQRLASQYEASGGKLLNRREFSRRKKTMKVKTRQLPGPLW